MTPATIACVTALALGVIMAAADASVAGTTANPKFALALVTGATQPRLILEQRQIERTWGMSEDSVYREVDIPGWRSEGLAAGLSAAVPGAGQAYAGSKRAWVYALAEVAGWTSRWLYLRRGHELQDQAASYAGAPADSPSRWSFTRWQRAPHAEAGELQATATCSSTASRATRRCSPAGRATRGRRATSSAVCATSPTTGCGSVATAATGSGSTTSSRPSTRCAPRGSTICPSGRTRSSACRAARADSGSAPPAHSLASTLALPVATPAFDMSAPAGAPEQAAWQEQGEAGSGAVAFLGNRKRKPREPEPASTRPPVVLSAERARTLLRSLTVPGWGQLATGHRTAATVFGIAEAGVWTSYVAFRIQNQLRRDAFIRSARVLAGIDLKGRDEEFQRIVGAFISSDEYNQLVVARDAANLYYNDPAAFNAYYDAHALKGADTWTWQDDQALLRYRGQRKDSQRATLRANAALAMAVVNRLLSAIHSARLGSAPSATSHTWEMQTQGPDGNDPTAFRVGIQRRF